MVDYEATYEGLQNMMLRELVFITCDISSQTFLNEKGKLGLKEKTQAAENYVEVHGNEVNLSEMKQNRWN